MLNLTFNNGTPPALNARNMNAIVESIRTLQTQVASPFNYKGVVADLTNLEAISDPAQNDTYYVTEKTCLYSWDGSTWGQSSLKESDYLEEITSIGLALDSFSGLYGTHYIPWSRGYYTIINNKVQEGSTASVIAKRLKSGSLTNDDLPVGTLVSCSGELRIQYYFCASDETVLSYQATAQTSLVIPDKVQYNGEETDYDHFFITAIKNDGTVASKEEAYDNIFIMLPDYVQKEFLPVSFYTYPNVNVSFAADTLTINVFTETRFFIKGQSKIYIIPAGTYNITIGYSNLSYVCWNGSSNSFYSTPFGNKVDTDTIPLVMIYKQSGLIVYNAFSENKIIHKCAVVGSGPVFLWYANGKAHLQVGSTTRIFVENKLLTFSDTDYDVTSPATFSYLCLGISSKEDGGYIAGFYRKVYSDLNQNDDYIIGYCYNGQCYSDSNYVICNKAPLFPVVSRTDIPIYINVNRLGYNVVPTYVVMNESGAGQPKTGKFGPTWKLENMETRTIRIQPPDTRKYFWNTKNETIIENTVGLTSEKILMVGDSFTNRGWIQRRINEYAPNVVFLGSWDTAKDENGNPAPGITGYKCEAIGGSSAKGMISAGGYVHGSVLNHINGNYSGYVTTYLNGIVPNIVVIEFGPNETDATEYRENVQLLIDLIRAYDTAHSINTKIYVTTACDRCLGENTNLIMYGPYSITRGGTYAGTPQCVLEALSLTGYDAIIPLHMCLDDRYDYNHETRNNQYGYGVEMDVVTDFIHPSENVGFNKIGDMIYSYLGWTTPE